MATATSTAVGKPVGVPNASLYVQNLPEKLQKEDLRRALYMLFSTYGAVLDVTALKTAKMRGQAHVLFKDEHTATQAMRSCQGFEFFGREMRIAYSKNQSIALQRMRGTFQPTSAPNKPTAQTVQPPSSFPAPPGSLPAPPGSLPAPPGSLPGPPKGLPPPPGLTPPSGFAPPPVLPQKPDGDASLKAPTQSPQDAASPQGVKRQRDESDDDDAYMEQDDDDDGAMDISDD